MVTAMTALAHSRIWGTANAWSLAPFRDRSEPYQDCEIQLEIQGDSEAGFHLIMTPTGYLTADSWHPTKEEALTAAEELFAVSDDQWVNTK